jgi:signal transduction histidine kinase
MEEGDGYHFPNFLEPFRGPEGLLELRILAPDGTVLRSTRKKEEGSSMAALLDGSPPRRPPWVQERQIQGRPFLSSIQAFDNEPKCFSCHGREKKTLGLLNVTLPMEATYRSISFNRNLLIAATGITLLLMGLAINFLLNRLVKNPIDRLIHTMSRVEKGDLNAEVNLNTRDELGRLAQSFRSMVQKLSCAQRELEERQRQQIQQLQHLASMGEMAASVAHEVKNPLAGIRLAVQILAKDSPAPARHRETIEEVMHSIARLDKTITDLLAYSRVSPPEFKPTSLPEVIEAALSSIKEEGQAAGVRVQKHLDPALPLLPMDSHQMEGAFLNLFLNALQAMPKGGTLTIQVERHEPGYPFQKGFPPAAGSGREKGWVEVTVADTGEGIPPAILGEIFRPFFTTRARGTGLGLSLTHRAVEQNHGQIFAQSRVGVGTTFHLLFPLPSPRPEGGAPA